MVAEQNGTVPLSVTSFETSSSDYSTMSTIQVMTKSFAFNRVRTLATLEEDRKASSPGRSVELSPRARPCAHRLATACTSASPRRFSRRSGWPPISRLSGPICGRASAAAASPTTTIPSAATIREILAESRERLLATLASYTDERLGEIPPPLAQRKLTFLDVLHILSWHEVAPPRPGPRDAEFLQGSAGLIRSDGKCNPLTRAFGRG